MNKKYETGIRQFKQAWDGTMNGVKHCGTICAKEMVDSKWAETLIKQFPQFSLVQLEALRDVGNGKIIPELAGPRSLAEQEVAREWPLDRQYKLITTRVCVAVRKQKEWTKVNKFLYEINDYGTIQRVFDIAAKKVRPFEEQCVIGERKNGSNASIDTEVLESRSEQSENGKPDSSVRVPAHKRIENLIRGHCTPEQAKDIAYLVSRNDAWSESIWQQISFQRLHGDSPNQKLLKAA
jgi:hypothetical protein